MMLDNVLLLRLITIVDAVCETRTVLTLAVPWPGIVWQSAHYGTGIIQHFRVLTMRTPNSILVGCFRGRVTQSCCLHRLGPIA